MHSKTLTYHMLLAATDKQSTIFETALHHIRVHGSTCVAIDLKRGLAEAMRYLVHRRKAIPIKQLQVVIAHIWHKALQLSQRPAWQCKNHLLRSSRQHGSVRTIS
jgi:hypothetical protein